MTFRPACMIALAFAVTGKMAGGLKVIRQTIDREDALIAYTRKNAYFVFHENDLGSIQPGKLADLVTLDRDYLSVPADQIRDIKPVLTIVGGRVAYSADARTTFRGASVGPSGGSRSRRAAATSPASSASTCSRRRIPESRRRSTSIKACRPTRFRRPS